LQPRQYAAYTPSVGLAQRKVMQGDIMKMEMQLAAKEVSAGLRNGGMKGPSGHGHPEHRNVVVGIHCDWCAHS